MSYPIITSCNYKHLTQANSPATVFTGSGSLVGVFCASASATPTLAIADGSTTLLNTITPVAGTFYKLPANFGTSLVVTIGGTADITVFWNGTG
jgi:hypothetical protein